ncbi:hypothetical protein IFM89_030487 [Coptis chinensis]|uniref:3'-5' exonuclease domain-containing protein n=1 Tax=Coptis chinensis TaxID=261450 RepID=A0A835HCI2_9MAGN|nr:hypothetical protein IFM89_030487 [Coptis chinensis]
MDKARKRLPHNRLMNSSSEAFSRHDVKFSGNLIETTVTDSAETVENWVREVRQTYQKPFFVGLDCEWKPNYIRGRCNPLALLQLCIENKCLIIQLLYIDRIPRLLRGFLHDSSITFVGVEVESDVKKLRDSYGLECFNARDVRKLAMDSDWASAFTGRRPGLKDLAFEIAGLSMIKPKKVTMSNWDALVLKENQIEYACIDAYVSYRIGRKLLLKD